MYARSAIGMPGSETALEELMCRVLGVVAKIANDVSCGADSPAELLHNLETSALGPL